MYNPWILLMIFWIIFAVVFWQKVSPGFWYERPIVTAFYASIPTVFVFLAFGIGIVLGYIVLVGCFIFMCKLAYDW